MAVEVVGLDKCDKKTRKLFGEAAEIVDNYLKKAGFSDQRIWKVVCSQFTKRTTQLFKVVGLKNNHSVIIRVAPRLSGEASLTCYLLVPHGIEPQKVLEGLQNNNHQK